jgi:hypothetical protein
MNEIKYYVVSVSGYECYNPAWFACNCSAKDFQQSLSMAIDEAVDKLIKENHSYIEGNEILDKICLILKKKGYNQIKADKEFDLKGECLYVKETKYDPKPTIISDKAWKKILKHNKKIHDRTDEEWEKLEIK